MHIKSQSILDYHLPFAYMWKSPSSSRIAYTAGVAASLSHCNKSRDTAEAVSIISSAQRYSVDKLTVQIKLDADVFKPITHCSAAEFSGH